MKQLAQKGDVKSARLLAKEVVRSNKQKDKMSVAKARLGSIGIQLQHQLGEPSVKDCLGRQALISWPLSYGQSDRSIAEVD